MTKEALVLALMRSGVLQSERITRALRAVDRADFVPKEQKHLAYADEALSIGFEQTISQPYTVVVMLERLAAEEGDVVLEVGYGSGWQTALLAELVGKKGRVYAMEIVPELCSFGKENVAKYPVLSARVSFFCKDASVGITDIVKTEGGFDRIIAAASVPRVPKVWREQLKAGGVILYPKDGSIFKETKNEEGGFAVDEYPGFAFVPFVEQRT